MVKFILKICIVCIVFTPFVQEGKAFLPEREGEETLGNTLTLSDDTPYKVGRLSNFLIQDQFEKERQEYVYMSLLRGSFMAQFKDLCLISDEERGVERPPIFQLAPNVFALMIVHCYPASCLGRHVLSFIRSMDAIGFEHDSNECASGAVFKRKTQDYPGYLAKILELFPQYGEEDIGHLCPAILAIFLTQQDNDESYSVGIEEVLEKQLLPSHKFYLETNSEYMGAFENIPKQLEEGILKGLVAERPMYEDDENSESIKESMNEYRLLDLNQAEKELDDDTDVTERDLALSQVFSLVRDYRNCIMTERTFHRTKTTKNVLIMAGINHWIGPKGIFNIWKHLNSDGIPMKKAERRILRLQQDGTFESDPYVESLPSLPRKIRADFQKIHGSVPPFLP